MQSRKKCMYCTANWRSRELNYYTVTYIIIQYCQLAVYIIYNYAAVLSLRHTCIVCFLCSFLPFGNRTGMTLCKVTSALLKTLSLSRSFSAALGLSCLPRFVFFRGGSTATWLVVSAFISEELPRKKYRSSKFSTLDSFSKNEIWINWYEKPVSRVRDELNNQTNKITNGQWEHACIRSSKIWHFLH